MDSIIIIILVGGIILGLWLSFISDMWGDKK